MPLRILWTHNFPPENPNSRVFIDGAAATLRARGLDIRLEYLGNLRSLSGLAAARKCVERLSGEFDIVHAQYGSACAMASAAARVPKVVSVRGNDWNLHSSAVDFHYVHTRLARAMTRWAVSRYDRVIAVSRRMMAELQQRCAARVEALPSPIDLSRFQPRDRAAAREALGCAGDARPWVLFNAQQLDDPIKRYPLAKAAFALANARRQGELVLRVASGMLHERLPLEVAACDAILCTSETEGWPNSIKEALACNVPFVATDVSDLAEIAAREPACRVCEPQPATLAGALLEVLALPRPSDLRRHLSGMDMETTCDRLEAIYREMTAVPGTA